MWLMIIVLIIVLYLTIARNSQRPLETVEEHIFRKNKTAKARIVCGSIILGVCIILSIAAALFIYDLVGLFDPFLASLLASDLPGTYLFLIWLPLCIVLIHSGNLDRSDYLEYMQRIDEGCENYAVLDVQKNIIMYVRAVNENEAYSFALSKLGQNANISVQLCNTDSKIIEQTVPEQTMPEQTSGQAIPEHTIPEQNPSIETRRFFGQSDKYSMPVLEINHEPWACPICGAKGNTNIECKTCGTTNFEQARLEWENMSRMRKEQEEREELIKSKYLYGIYDDYSKKIMQIRANSESEALTLAQTHLGAGIKISARIMATLNKPGTVNLFAVYDTGGQILMYLREESISDARSFALAKLGHDNFRIEVADSVK